MIPILGLLKPLLGPLLDKIPDVNERRRLEAEAEKNLLDAFQGAMQAQMAINEKEAQHGSLFVAGWRPAIGWVCGLAFFWNFVVQPLFSWGAFLAGVDIGQAPSLDLSQMMPVLLGMLGLGGLRTYEKRAGVARTELKK